MHQFDPNRRPDSDYESGRLEHLIVGNMGRVLDSRRTPVRVTALRTATGFVTFTLLAFEDAGATWDIPLEQVGSYEFERGSALAAAADVAAFEDAVARLDRPLSVDGGVTVRDATERQLAAHGVRACDWLSRHSRFCSGSGRLDTDALSGPPELAADLRAFLAEQELLDVEEQFAEQYVRNPHAGEIVKGHRIVIAELGLVPYQGSAVRDEVLFDGAWSKARRADHVMARLAFVRAAFARAGLETVTLFRGVSSDGGIRSPVNQTFVSASFNREVAESCAGRADGQRVRLVQRQAVPVRRVFMSYLETREMNQHYSECEAVLLHEPGHPLF